MGISLLESLPIVGEAANMVAQGFANRAQRRYNTQMYERQRADSLADWHMQNEYNSPAAQMKRFEDAKLNKNLIYGNQSTVSGPVRSSQVESYKPTPVSNNMTGLVMAFVDMAQKRAEIDKLKEMTELIKTQRELLPIKMENIKADTALKGFNKYAGESMLGPNLEVTRQKLEKLRADTTFTQDQNVRNQLMTGANLEKIASEILRNKFQNRLSDAQIKNLGLDSTMKQLDIKLAEKGIYRSDPVYARIASNVIDSITNHLKGSTYFKPDASWLEKIIKAWRVFK